MKRLYSKNVFINCPFDKTYSNLFYAIVFSVINCGYQVRCALEISDSSEIRIEKIARIISECKYGIHDISRTQIDPTTNLPRFNMPLELGLFLGSKRFGDARQRKKNCLILDTELFRYQKFISDISGQDIKAHNNQIPDVTKVVSDWLRTTSGSQLIPGGKEILKNYKIFEKQLPAICKKVKLTVDEMVFNDFTWFAADWLNFQKK